MLSPHHGGGEHGERAVQRVAGRPDRYGSDFPLAARSLPIGELRVRFVNKQRSEVVPEIAAEEVRKEGRKLCSVSFLWRRGILFWSLGVRFFGLGTRTKWILGVKKGSWHL